MEGNEGEAAPQPASVLALHEPPSDVHLPSASASPQLTSSALPQQSKSETEDQFTSIPASARKSKVSSLLWSGRSGEASVIGGRQGSVLTRGLVLKTDHFQGTRVTPTQLDISLQGAPNFRRADIPLDVYGVAQPSITGLKTILTVVDAAPLIRHAPPRGSRVWSRTASQQKSDGLNGQDPRASKSAFASPAVNAHERPSLDTVANGGKSPLPASEKVATPFINEPVYTQPDQEPRKAVWVCTREEPILYIGARPFVLREHANPTATFAISPRAENLEAIEKRLKQDVIKEASRLGGVIMVHEEEGDASEPKLKPTWISVDTDTVKTIRELFDELRSQAWRVDYHRVPIGQGQPIENNYLDAYTRILRNLDPTRSCVIANCGAGVNRTTFAMVAAQIVRRRQLILMGRPDPFQLSDSTPPSGLNITSPPLRSASPRVSGISTTKADGPMLKSLRATWEKQAQAQSLLRLVQILGKAGSESPVDLLLANPNLLEAMRRALIGDFSVIRGLCGILDHGLDEKVIVDLAIDSAAHLTNLREAIILHRASYALIGADGSHGASGSSSTRTKAAAAHLDRAVRALEKYFFLCAFSSYVSGSQKAVFEHSFSEWLKRRHEIWNNIQRIRAKGKQLYLFDPVADLSHLRTHRAPQSLSRLALGLPASKALQSDDQHAAGDEFADHHVQNLRSGIVLRPGTLLKEDIWQAQRAIHAGGDLDEVRGAINFRQIPKTAIFATGQPTVDGIRGVLASIAEQAGKKVASDWQTSCTWINLREEPLLYIAGKPYVLRDSTLSLRNMKGYGGISWGRLQLLEDRLKADVIAELEQNDGRLLLHSEDANGDVYPLWQEVRADDIETLQDVMAHVASELHGGLSISLGNHLGGRVSGELTFRRIPFTAERPPDYEDIGALLQTVLRAQGGSIVINCQLGRGRSTLASVIVLLISQWLFKHSTTSQANASETSLLAGGELTEEDETSHHRRSPLSYHLINSLLRVVPHGLQVKQTVDEAIDRAGAVTNLRDGIEDARLAAEDIEDQESPQRKQRIAVGCQALRRYFSLIVFQAYLNATQPDTLSSMPTFESFVRRQPVLSTIGKEFEHAKMSLITPLQRVEAADGMALDDEANEVVANRSGAILTAYTMLKSDFFAGIAKVHLSQIEGIPNLRSLPILIHPDGASSDAVAPQDGRNGDAAGAVSDETYETWGSGMPTIEGLRRGLIKMGAGPEGNTTIVWTSLREEPVIYVRGRPHVLRLADQPLTNLEATGITTETVESQELALKNDIIREGSQRDGRVLLHDEVEVEPGKFDIIPVWESIKPTDVLTPREAYELVRSEGFKVNYARVAVTDEQAPVPAVFSEIEKRVLEALRTGGTTAFNCQMGRGRTTTGMVIASLITTVYHYGDEIIHSEMGASAILSGEDSMVASTSTGLLATPGIDRMDGAKDFLDNREDELWLQGEYRMILQLVGVLSHGKLAKRLADGAIDRMDAVQNLRKAIYDSRMRAENAEPGTRKRKHLSTVFVNYLQRYAFLIAFANYLVEKTRAALVSADGNDSDSAEGEGDDTEEDRDRDDSVVDDGRSTTSTATTAAGGGGGGGGVRRQRRRSGRATGSGLALTATRSDDDVFPSFLQWLRPRREVDRIIRTSGDDRVA